MSNLLFSRNTKVYLEKDSQVWEVPVLDGFSFSQAQNTSEVTLSEAVTSTGKSKRSRRVFNDSFAPAEWSLSTYIRPFAAVAGAANGWQASGTSADIHAVEEVLWACLVSKPAFTASSAGLPGTDASWSKGITNETTGLTIGFDDSEVSDLGTFNIYFVTSGGTDTKVYKIADCCVNEASVDFDIDGIATINWGGFGSLITEESSAPSVTINEKITDTSNFIRNRLTSLTLKTVDDHLTSDGDGADDEYNIVLTGGNITFSNNITYLTPEFLGKVNKPIGHVVGTRNIGGSLTCYLDTGTYSGKRNPADLFKDIMNEDSVVTNSFDMDISIGGASGNRVEVSLPRCHLEIPTHSIEDVISLEVNFHALADGLDPTDGGNADSMEAKLVYKV